MGHLIFIVCKRRVEGERGEEGGQGREERGGRGGRGEQFTN